MTLPTPHKKILIANVAEVNLTDVTRLIENLLESIEENDNILLIKLLSGIVKEYTPDKRSLE